MAQRLAGWLKHAVYRTSPPRHVVRKPGRGRKDRPADGHHAVAGLPLARLYDSGVRPITE
jgi:hypothetical protein